MKKILHVVSCLEKGGTEAFIMNNFRHIDREQYGFDFLVFDRKESPYADEIRSLGGNVHYIMLPSLRNLKKFIDAFAAILKEYGPYNAVHSHLNSLNAWVMLAAFIGMVPLRVSHAHAIVSKGKGAKRVYETIKRIVILRTANVWLACSKEAGASLYGERNFRYKGIVVNNGIRIEQFLPGNQSGVDFLREEFQIQGTDFVLGNITRFDKNKNLAFAVEVFAELLKKKPEAVLLLGGFDGGELENVKALAAKLGVGERVRFVGVRSDVDKCLQLMNAYIFPSLTEGLGIAVLEAQAAGVPCFVSNGLPRTVDMELELVKFMDLNDGAAVWAETICNFPKLYKPHEEIARAFSAQGFNVKNEVKCLERIYDGKGAE